VVSSSFTVAQLFPDTNDLQSSHALESILKELLLSGYILISHLAIDMFPFREKKIHHKNSVQKENVGSITFKFFQTNWLWNERTTARLTCSLNSWSFC